MIKFWQQLPRPFFVLAPMEAVTDIVFRHVVDKAARPDVFMTEFTSAAGYNSPNGRHSTRGRLTFSSDEQPIVAQIWGNNPEHFAFMAHDLAEMGFAGIDINMGCPDKAVIRQGSGSKLIGNLEISSELIEATKTARLPVSVKTRLGNTRVDEWQPWLTHLLSQDLANLTIHLRTRREMSKVPAHYELIDDIVKLRNEIAPQTLLTINGDIQDYAHGLELADQHKVDGLMIGRGIFTSPFAFEKSPRPHTRQELLDLLNLQLDLHDQYSRQLEPRKFDPLKRFFKIYIRDFDGASDIRHKLMQAKNTSEARAIIETSVTNCLY